MKRILLILISCMVFSLIAYAAQDDGMEPADGFFLPKGSPSAGRKAFQDLKCTSCHWVANDPEFSGPVAEKPGPVLGLRQKDYASGWLANSIVSPSHTIALGTDGTAEESTLSRMGDFTEVMTVKQLIDLVAYLKAPKDSQSES